MKDFWKTGLAGICLALVLNFPAYAGNSWLDQGKSVLNSLGNSGSSKDSTSSSTKSSSSSSSSAISNLSVDEISSGLKEALEVASEAVVKQLGATDGFNSDDNIHIPLPSSLSTAQSLLNKAGFSSLTDDLELKLNRAAEAATPKAKELFMNAISAMTFDDAKEIYQGADDAATQYFKEKMSDDLSEAMTPVVEEALTEVQAVQAYDTMVAKYKTLPLVPDVKANLSDYVVEKGMDGIFYYMAQKEKAIRENPVEQTTSLLKKLFN